MTVTWTCTFTRHFDLDSAEEDYSTILYFNPEKEPEEAIYDAVEANLDFSGSEYIEYYQPIEQCAKALRTRIGGVQMRMELD